MTFSSTVTKTDNTNILIRSGRSNPPEYSVPTYPLVVNWAGKRLTRSGTTVSVTITDENSFEINYTYGGSLATYAVKQVYRRK